MEDTPEKSNVIPIIVRVMGTSRLRRSLAPIPFKILATDMLPPLTDSPLIFGRSTRGQDGTCDFLKMKSASTAQETLNQIYGNRSLSSVYSIPRRQTGAGSCLEEVKKDGREWREVIKIVQQSVVDKNTMARWQIDKIQLCVNTTLEEQFIKKRQKMKEDGRSNKELMEQHAFHVVSHAKAKHVCQSGLEVCQGPSVFANILGRSDMGVHLRRNADITLKLAEKCSYTQTALVVFKVIPGRMKSIPTSFKLIKEAMEPTPNFDCHVSNRKPTAWQKEAHQLANSCIYLYEYDDSCHPSKAPRQILPYAVLTCTLVSPPKVPVTSVISVTDVSTTDTDGSCSDMDIVDDSDDAKDDEVKKAESSSTSVSTEDVRGKQASERSKKLSVEDIQGCNLGPSSQSKAGVFVKPLPFPCGNKKTQKTNHSTHPTTSQGTRRTTLLQPATFQYGSKESKTSDQSTVQSESNSGGTSSQRLKNMAAGFFAKLKDPRIQRTLQSKKSHASSGVKGGTRSEPERKPDIPKNAQECRLKAKAKPKMRQAEHSTSLEMKSSSEVLKTERDRKQETMSMGCRSKQVSTKCSTSSKSLTVGRSASKHTGGITKRKPSTRFKEKMKKQLADVLLADEIKIPPRKGQMSAGIQKEKKPGENVKETKTRNQQSGFQDGKSSAFERQVLVKNIRHTDDKQNATESNPAEQPEEGLKKGSDTPVKELLSGKASGLDPSDSEHTEMLSALQSLDQTLDHLTPSTVAVSSSEMSDSTSEETLCRAHKVNKTVFVKTEENVSASVQEEESKCLEVMDMLEQNVFQAAQIDYERNKVSAGNMSPKERSVKLEVDLEEMQRTDTNNGEESTAHLQASGSKNHPEDSSSKRTIKQEATDTTDPSCQNLCVKADFTEESLMESQTCDEEATGGNNSTMFVIDQVFSLAGNGTSQTLAQEQEEKIIPEDTVRCLPYEQATSNVLPASQIGEPQGHNQNGLPVSDAMDLGSKAGNLEISITRPFVTTTSVGVARPQTSRPSVSEDTSSAILGRRDATAGVRGGQGCQTSYQSRSCMWLRKDAMLESLLMGSLNTLELGIQNLQARSDCPQLVIAVRTAATIATRTSATLLELAVQEVRDHMSSKPDQMLGGMLQEPTLDCRKLESLISGTINTLKMTSDNMDDSCSLQSSFRTALTLLELALDIVWIRSQPRGSTIGQPELYNIPPSQGESMASEAHRPMECQSNVFSSQWEESGRHWHTNNERAQQVTVFPMEKQEGHGSSQRKLATGEAAELGADHCSNLIGTSGKCGDLEPECAVIGTKEMSASMQTKMLHTGKHNTSKVEGSCDDKEVTPNLSINVQNMTVDHNENNHVEVNLEAVTGKTYPWHLAKENAKRRDRNEELTPMQCDEPMPLEKARTEQEGELKGEEEKSSLKMKAAFPSEDTRAMPGFALFQETADRHRMLCDHEESRNQAETQPCTKNSSSPEQMRRRMEESNAKLTQKHYLQSLR
ncbi:regulation of double-strand break repair via homologous recombination [Branchiostoma belcheri]|nr:regulation of double-strand break repair via homologous recombination [Branchiostoma belcheri]